MIVESNHLGDDEFENRLLLYLTTFTGENFKRLKKIKNGIWSCLTDDKKWLLKVFSSLNHIENQRNLTNQLYNHGFYSTYQFHPIHTKKICLFENKIYGLIEYINKGRSFTYHTSNERRKALLLLQYFHHTTSKFENKFRSTLPTFNQINKWESRLNEFISNMPLLRNFIHTPFLETYIDWAKYSLIQMKKYDTFNKIPTSIIHGDVAHHNFLLSKDNKLYLIDFDLIHLGTPNTDYLQFCNRILPYISWSFNDLKQYRVLSEFLEDKAFLYALIFPTDIFREWNRYVKNVKNNNNGSSIKYLEKITHHQFKQREAFVNTILKYL